MEVIRELRPVEALYILDHAKKESMTRKNSLAAVVAYLANEGYIQPAQMTDSRQVGVRLTERGSIEFSSLRHYEKGALRAIATDDPKGLLKEIENYDFNKQLVRMGFMKREERHRSIWPLRWTEVSYSQTHKYDQALEELAELREGVDSALRDGSEEPYLVSMSYAFPSERFLKLIGDAPRAVDTTKIVIATVIAAMNIPIEDDHLKTS